AGAPATPRRRDGDRRSAGRSQAGSLSRRRLPQVFAGGDRRREHERSSPRARRARDLSQERRRRAGLFRGVRHEPPEVRVSERRRRRRHRRGNRRGASPRARRDLSGKNSRRGAGRRRTGTRQEVTTSKFALELQKAKGELAANEQQLNMHETAYGNSLKKIQHANEKLIELREKIQKYDAELKMSSAEAEIAKLSETFDVNLTTDFGE